MYPDYIKIQFDKTEETSHLLDGLLEMGHIMSLEVKAESICVLDLWENREKLLLLFEKTFTKKKWLESRIKGRDWNREWIEGFQPIRVNRGLWITPPWHLDKIPKKHEKVIINPGNAFGTGTHESTFLALKLIKKTIIKGDRVIDFGCGSGILSIAAKKLGAATVHAIDNDPEIEHNFMENLEKNGVDNITMQIGDILSMVAFHCDLALINIQKHVILPLLKRFSVANGMPNRVILAGLLNEHRKDIRNALKESGYKVLKIRRKKEWIAVSAIQRRVNEV
jgi:ribosomal protein L11 methyltransferase